MAKTDVRSAFCIVPVHPSDYPLLGFQWKGNGIMIKPCLWDVQVHAKYLRISVQRWNGSRRTVANSRYHTHFG